MDHGKRALGAVTTLKLSHASMLSTTFHSVIVYIFSRRVHNILLLKSVIEIT